MLVSAVRLLRCEVDGALGISEQSEIWVRPNDRMATPCGRFLYSWPTVVIAAVKKRVTEATGFSSHG